jgi:two-component system cell cycle sensor histidine kinase/response regulator CckA
MAKLSQKSSSRRLIISYGMLIVLFVLLGLLSISDMRTAAALTRTIYAHPFKVSNASLQSSISITRMHRSMKDVVLVNSSLKINALIESVLEQEQHVYASLDIVKRKILGDAGRALEKETRKLFKDWKPIREEVIDLVHRGQTREAAKITMGQGGEHVALLESKMLALTDYARNKASVFMQDAEIIHSRMHITLIVFLTVGIISSCIVAFFTTRQTLSAARSVEASKVLLDATQRLTKVGGWEWDIEKQSMFWTKEVYRIHGFEPVDFSRELTDHIERSLACYAPEDHAKVTTAFRRCVEEGQGYDLEFPFTTVKGRKLWVRTIAEPVFTGDRITKVIGNIMDITERNRAEKARRESEARYRSLTELLPLGIFEIDNQGKVTFANESAYQLTGYDRNDFEAGLNISNVIASRDHDKMLKLYQQALQGVYSDGSEFQIQRKNSSIFHGFINARPTRDDVAPGLIGYIFDLTRLQEAEAALRESEQKFRTLVEQSPLGISLIGKEGRYKYVNPRFQEMFGYTIDDCPTGKQWFKLAYTDKAYRQKVMEAWIKELQQADIGQARPRVDSVTCRDGSQKEIHFRPVTMENGDQFVVYEDVTERSRMEHQLQQTQKFEAIGTLAGGIAHDFNNLLMGIQGRASLISADLEPFHSHLEHTNAIEDYIRSATDLTRQLLGLARGGKYEVKPADTNELVRNSSNMFGRTKKEIRIHTSFADPPPVVMVDRSQIEQVLLNLYINAWQAMPGGGELYLETQIVTLNEAYCKPYNAKPGQYAKVSVTDTGIGMGAETKQQIFDPFFTTKEKGRGTGLGLASAYGIIKHHEGIIIVHSEVGHGTTFNIYLPLSEKEAYRELPIEERLVRGAETVLLVDDEEMILEVGQDMLVALGYRVVVAASGEQAVDIFKRKGAEIDLVILDLIMPDMDGGKVFDLIKEIRPQMPVLLASGYAIDGYANEIIQRGCNGFIQKPFNLSAFSHKVRKILDEAQNSA